MRIVDSQGVLLEGTALTKDFGPPHKRTAKEDGYLVETREVPRSAGDYFQLPLFLQYGRPLETVDATVARLRLFLIIGVLSGAGLALLAGLMVARRAMTPIAELTATARKIEQTRRSRRADPRPSRPTTRSPSWRGRSTACSTRWTPRAPRPRTRCGASASSSPTPRTSCVRR